MTLSRIMTSGAIVAAGAVVALGIVAQPPSATSHTPGRAESAYVTGNPDGTVRIVEFSDFECPFCARLHPTLARITGEIDSVTWEYRHFPLPNHRNAEAAAIAGECIGMIGGNAAFWKYVDAAFTNQRTLGDGFYESEAARLGIDADAFNACRSDPAVAARVTDDYQTAIALGGNGTPFVVVEYEDGSTKTFAGALPYDQVRALVTREVP